VANTTHRCLYEYIILIQVESNVLQGQQIECLNMEKKKSQELQLVHGVYMENSKL